LIVFWHQPTFIFAHTNIRDLAMGRR
jgi:hypothetical protein